MVDTWFCLIVPLGGIRSLCYVLILAGLLKRSFVPRDINFVGGVFLRQMLPLGGLQRYKEAANRLDTIETPVTDTHIIAAWI
jgi:hypothetical protein